MRAAGLAVVVLLAATLTACGSDGDGTKSVADRSPTPSQDGTTTAGGPVSATENLLDWKPLDSAADTVVSSGEWSLAVPSGATAAILDGPARTKVAAGAGRKIVDTFLTDTTAVVVAQDQAETRPQVITVVDLASGKKSTVTDPPPGPGGPFAVSGATLAYATYKPGGDYCLATFDLGSGSGEKGYCAPRRHGFSNIAVTPAGTAMMTFDAARPVACRTLVDVDGAGVTPVEGVRKCTGWDVAATPTGHIWSTLPHENRVELGDFHASADGTTYDLGQGQTGTLTWCGDSAYFARDGGGKARASLLRWTPEATLEVVYEAPGEGESFLAAPTCAGTVLTVEAYGEGGDEIVSATVPG
ncbi:hypothetical protein [Nocardioides jensenii]|uniref:hypothetical protein n=1 Tax=Nocardioides jensenii TaxID=1843 RepID=UPI000834FEE5|nr:hypothetical protein [Nocardioides jensenii]